MACGACISVRRQALHYGRAPGRGRPKGSDPNGHREQGHRAHPEGGSASAEEESIQGEVVLIGFDQCRVDFDERNQDAEQHDSGLVLPPEPTQQEQQQSACPEHLPRVGTRKTQHCTARQCGHDQCRMNGLRKGHAGFTESISVRTAFTK